MRNKVVLTKSTFEKILEHLVKLEENKNKLLDEYYPELNDERIEFIELMSEYVSKIDKEAKNIKFSDDAENEFPFVILGSEVEIQDIEDNAVFKYRLVSPYERDITNGYISFLSPVGKSLLLKNKGDDVSVSTPGGVYRYRIKNIRVC